jgi:hypothetical protein
MVRVVVDEHLDSATGVENLDYLRQLARDLHKVTLKSEQ